MRLKDKRAVITGSSAGIGRAIAIKLAQEGAKVVINARGGEAVDAVVREIAAQGGQASGMTGSVDDEAVAQNLIAHCVDTFGGIDILINNAAIFGPESIGPVDACPSDIWRQTLSVNLDGPFYLAKAALPHMKQQGWGRVINASSMAGTGSLGGSAYSVSKAALVGLTRSLAADYGPYGITVNAYNPEALTAMGDSQDSEAYDAFLSYLERRGLRTATDTAYSKGTGGPDAIAPWVAYLCTDAADYLNGQVFAVESRRVAMLAMPEEQRSLFRDHARSGVWSLDELELMAPMAFRVRNAWPRRTGQALKDWLAG